MVHRRKSPLISPDILFSLVLLLAPPPSLCEGPEEYGVVRQIASFHEDERVQFSISAFGEEMLFNFTRNKDLLMPGFKVKTKSGHTEESPLGKHFTYQSPSYIASLSDFGGGEIYGFVSGQGRTIEIHPLNDGIPKATLRGHSAVYMIRDDIFLIKEIQLPPSLIDDEFRLRTQSPRKNSRKYDYGIRKHLMIELAVFVDDDAYGELLGLYGSDQRVFNILLAYMNQIHAIFKIKSLGVNVDISLTKLEILNDYDLFQKYNGERDQLLRSFCRYQHEINHPNQRDPEHWDMAVLLTGLDLWSNSKRGRRDYSTLGVAPTGGICTGDYSCALAELRGSVRGRLGHTVSNGFTSSYILAHEIGHALGLSHDGQGDGCKENGFIMSSTRDSRGEAKWSQCSADKLERLTDSLTCLFDAPGYSKENYEQNAKYKGIPGFFIKRTRQCQLYLRDESASAVLPQEGVCKSLHCKDSQGTIYEAGPALTGTYCGNKRWCKAGECARRPKWSKWAYGPCKSGCLQSSLGTRTLSRRCISGTDCVGPSSKTQLCDDNTYCERKSAQRTITFISRKSRTIFADRECKGYARRNNFFSLRQSGKAGAVTKYDERDPKRACIIYCRSRDKGWISPSGSKQEPIYFPEGTWCYYNEKIGEHYYCINHKCVPNKKKK